MCVVLCLLLSTVTGTDSDGAVQGTLDILVQRTGRQGEGTITFVQNNVFHDAFFLKAIGTYLDSRRCPV